VVVSVRESSCTASSGTASSGTTSSGTASSGAAHPMMIQECLLIARGWRHAAPDFVLTQGIVWEDSLLAVNVLK
jgi:hypothetical protein